MKEAYYFRHDYGARNDDKILEIRAKYNNEGYAVFFYCLEVMAERNDGYIMADLLGGLSLGFGVGKEWLIGFLEFCQKIDVFKKNEIGYYSPRIIKHLKFRSTLSEGGKIGAAKRWGGYSSPNANKNKLNKIKLNNTNTIISIAEQNSASNEVNKIFDLFYKINPGINFGNKTQRSSVEWLINKFGKEKAIKYVEAAIAAQGMLYAPRITTPLHLKEKLGDLNIFYKNQENSNKSTIIV